MTGTRRPDVPSPVPGPVICLMTATSHRILQPTVPITIPGAVTLLEAMSIPRTHHPAAVPGPVPGPITRLVTFLTSRTPRTSSLDLGPRPGILRNFKTVSRMHRLSSAS